MRMIRRREDSGNEERGAVLVLTAFLMALLLGIAALAVDIVIFQQARIRAQATVDASVLAAVQDLPIDIATATAAAQEYALRNYDVAAGAWPGCSDPQALSVSTGVSCISVNAETPPTLIRVRLPDRPVETFFAPILGMDTFSVSAAATAEIEYSGGSSEVPTDEGGATPQEIADFVRAGDPGGGYDTCGPIDPPSSLPSGPGATHWGEYIFVFEHLPIGGAEFGETTTVCGTSAEAVTDP
ncbi:MAG: TadG family pilus assembly protein, partial [Acidimicrobiia bacterium]